MKFLTLEEIKLTDVRLGKPGYERITAASLSEIAEVEPPHCDECFEGCPKCQPKN